MAYEELDLPLPLQVRANSTQGMASYKALFSVASLYSKTFMMWQVGPPCILL